MIKDRTLTYESSIQEERPDKIFKDINATISHKKSFQLDMRILHIAAYSLEHIKWNH